jgi:flagellar hook-associated protein 2
MVTGSVAGLSPTLSRLSAAGITLSGGDSLRFDEQAFREALERDPEAIVALFTHEEIGEDGKRVVTGFGGLIEDDLERLTSADTGVIPIREESIRASERLLNERISQMEVLLGRRRERLLDDFYAMESALARLQSQQTALSQLAILSMPTES